MLYNIFHILFQFDHLQEQFLLNDAHKKNPQPNHNQTFWKTAYILLYEWKATWFS